MSNEVGGLYRSSLSVTDALGAAVDASTQILTVTLPDGTTATPVVTHDGTGAYHSDYLFMQEGLHVFRWVTTGPNTTKTDYANADVFRSIIGLDETKNYVNFGDSGNEDILRQIMQAATELCENVVGSCVQRHLTNIRIPGNSKIAIRLPQGPVPTENSVTSIASVYSNGPVWLQSTGDFIVSPESGVVELAGLIPFWLGPWKATYTVGRLVIPQSIQLAAKEIIYDMWSTQRPYGAAELEPGPEATARFEQMVATYSTPAHASALLAPYEMPGFG
jgi:hypothetical protein